jgi:polyisoprenoid-binding protein YceI
VPTYVIEPGRSTVVVRAKSSIHDTDSVWPKLAGTVDADAGTLAASGATARLTVDMTDFDAGDFLKNRKLRKDLDVKSHPQATFELARLVDVVELGDAKFEAVAEGTLRWRGRDVAVRARGSGTVTDAAIDANATFELDVRELGVKPPRFLMFKVEDIVDVAVTLRAIRG